MTASAVVHLIDDDPSIRQSLSFLLTCAGFAVRVHESAVAFIAALPSLQPGCIVSDVRMPGIDGIELQRRLKPLGVTSPVIIMTGHADVPLAVEAMKAGAVDFIEKPFDSDTMIAAIRTALALHDKVDGQEAEAALMKSKLHALSGREREVLDGLVAGRANKVIAADLGLSPRTVEVHRANVMSKTGAQSLSELVRIALLAGLIPSA